MRSLSEWEQLAAGGIRHRIRKDERAKNVPDGKRLCSWHSRSPSPTKAEAELLSNAYRRDLLAGKNKSASLAREELFCFV